MDICAEKTFPSHGYPRNFLQYLFPEYQQILWIPNQISPGVISKYLAISLKKGSNIFD